MKFKNLQKKIKGLGMYNVKQDHTISERKKKHSMVLPHMRTVAYNIYVFCLGGSVTPSPGIHVSKESGMLGWRLYPKPPPPQSCLSPDSTPENAQQTMTPPQRSLR